MPLLVLADRSDIGGLSTNYHPQLESAAIFIYDGIPGGAGFSEEAYERADQLISHTTAAIERCPCESGCPACVQSPKCGSGNFPMDKQGAAVLLKALSADAPCTATVSAAGIPFDHQGASKAPGITAVQQRDYCVFDLETQCSAQQVGGWHKAGDMKMSCGVIYDAEEDQFVTYREDQVNQLIRHLQRRSVVVGFNVRRFDFLVLSAYTAFDFQSLKVIDLLDEVHRVLGYRLSLDHLAQMTLGMAKTGSGLEALHWWQTGEIEKIITYCRNDVCITRDLFEFVRRNGYLLYRVKDGGIFRVPINIVGL
jgi:DEAD/DEAH box helicase domain-containing protein